VEGLDSTDIAEIPTNVVEENIYVFAEADLQAEEAVAIMEKTESVRRKRRAVGTRRGSGEIEDRTPPITPGRISYVELKKFSIKFTCRTSTPFTDMSAKTASDLIAMGSTLLALTPGEILSITNATFLDAVAEISEIQGFSSEQLQAWASKAASVSINGSQ
jgi:hypothetical protein